MHRGLLRLVIAPGLPPLVEHLPGGTVLTPFGCWMRERVASLIPDWPAVGFHRLEITALGLDLHLRAGDHSRATAQFAAVLAAVRRETARAAVRSGWATGEIWREESLSIAPHPRAVRPARMPLRPDPQQQHDGEREEEAVHRPRGEVV